MNRTLTQTWWLLALCGVLHLANAAMNLLMLNPDGSPALRTLGTPGVVRDISVLALTAGACVIAAGLWNSGKENSWLLALHGLGIATFGLVGLSPLVRGPLSFRPVSLLFVLMAASIGVFALRTAGSMRSGAPGRSFLVAAGAVSLCFGVSFFGVGFRWMSLGPPYFFWIWMSSYFAFCGMFMLWLARRFRRPGLSYARWEAPTPVATP